MKFVERLRRCKYCGSDMTDTVSCESYMENPFCNGCYDERVTKANEAMGPTKVVIDGHYVRHVPIEPQRPAEGSEP